MRRLLLLGLLVPGPAPSSALGPESDVCVRETVTARDGVEFATEAIAVLEACGHDPSAYRLELRLDDPLSRVGTESAPGITAVFLPLDAERDYPVGVSPADPCVLFWSWETGRLTRWQQRVLERARAHAALGRDGRNGVFEFRVTETRDHVGVRWWSGEAFGSDRRVVLVKGDLSPVGPWSRTSDTRAPHGEDPGD